MTDILGRRKVWSWYRDLAILTARVPLCARLGDNKVLMKVNSEGKT